MGVSGTAWHDPERPELDDRGPGSHNRIVFFIWGIAGDVLRDFSRTPASDLPSATPGIQANTSAGRPIKLRPRPCGNPAHCARGC